MRYYRADLHIHTVLSPCADIDMGPVNIIEEAAKKNIDIIGITDHNTTRQCATVSAIGRDKGVFVLPGVEVNSKEEIHCLAFFEDLSVAAEFESYLEEHRTDVKNDADIFGQQMIVDEQENITGYIEELLTAALNVDIEDISKKVHELDGIFIPAHIDREFGGIINQLGFIPENLETEALEVVDTEKAARLIKKDDDNRSYTFIRNSDAHFPDNIGQRLTKYFLNSISFKEIKMALSKVEGRHVKLV